MKISGIDQTKGSQSVLFRDTGSPGTNNEGLSVVAEEMGLGIAPHNKHDYTCDFYQQVLKVSIEKELL